MDTGQIPLLVAIESDVTRYYGEQAQVPRLLDRAGSQQVLAHVASDLRALYPRLDPCSLCLAGALFDQTQVLRPAFPVFAALAELAKAARDKDAGSSSRLLGIGASQGLMPRPQLQPDPDIPPAALQLLPLLVTGPAAQIADLADDMEHRFLDQGQLSAHSALGLESAFGIGLVHARFMTVTDLLAMLHLQLEHFGFLPLWQLLDAALNQRREPLSVVGRRGQSFEWDGERVRCQFETFDAYARRDPASADELPDRYAAWVREYRQYMLTLVAHRVPLAQHLPGLDTPLEGTFLVESVPWAPGEEACSITEQGTADLGVIAVTVVVGDHLLHFYPLTPSGLNDLHRHIRESGYASRGFAYPGQLVFDPRTRCLTPDCAIAGGA